MKEGAKSGANFYTTVLSTGWQDNVPHDLLDFFGCIDEVFFTVDMINHRLMQISSACEKLFGYSQEDFLSDPLFWIRLIHPDDQHIIDAEDMLLERGQNVHNEYRIICKDGTIKWVENKILPTLDDDGILIRIDGLTRDISRRKEAEEIHWQSEERYRQIVETAQEGVWTIDVHEKTNFVNKKICEMLGYTPEEMMGKEPYDFMYTDDRAEARGRIKRRRNGSKENLDVRYMTKAGKTVWANISSNPIIDEHGVYKGALAMVTDITQRKLDEDAIKKSEASLRTILNNSDTAYVLFTTQMTIVSFNTLAQEFSIRLNHKKLEVNRSIKDYFSEDRWGFVKSTLDKVAQGESIIYELNTTREDGSPLWNEVKWINVKDDNGQNQGFMLANKDITREKLAALEREKITADLIQHNKDLEQFTYIISHNLRAPVANIMALTGLLKDIDLDNESKLEIIDRVSHSIDNLDTVIRDLNQILQARELVNEKKETVYFRELMDTIRTSIYNVIVSENVHFQYNFSDIESIFSIRSYLYSIFYNLASNSIKYRSPGVAPAITIKSHRMKNKIELRFKDNGKGIDLEKYKSHVFGLYKRFDTSMEGKGMGLFMVKTQVEALGGTIRIKSKPGEGTEFVIQLPA